MSKQIHAVCQMIETADQKPADYNEWVAFMKGWVDDFKTTRTILLKRREDAVGVIPAADAEQSEVAGVIPTTEPSSATSKQDQTTMGETSASSSSAPMSEELQAFREQKKQEREKLEAWARIFGISPPETSTTVERSTHRFEQWLERQLKVNRETLAQQSNFPEDEN